MKKFICLLALLVWGTSHAQTPDCLIDSVQIISPYWGLRFESGIVPDTFFKCGSSNVNFVVGQPYLIARFPLNIANMGTSVAYFGRYGQNGIVHDACYSPQFTNPTDFLNIPNFITAYILDSCGNVINWNRKTDWNIQNNSQYAVSTYNGQTTYITQYFGLAPTTGTSPNPLKDWLVSKCGTLDTTISVTGRALMDAYYSDCIVCDSLVLFPNYVSGDQGIVQLPTNLAPGNYYLAVSSNFYMLNQGSNCYSDSLVIPFNWNGGVGQSQTYPYFANGITYLSQGFGTCLQASIPSAPTNLNASSNGTISTVTWSSNNPSGTSFRVTPYVVVNGNTEKAVTSLTRVFASSPATYTNQELRNAGEIAQLFGVSRNNLKFRFRVKAENSAGSSAEISTGNPALQVR